MDFIKKNQHWLSFLLGIGLSVLMYAFNPFFLDANANKAVAVAVLMITWWVAEALPMPVVALIPLVLHPLFKISTIEEKNFFYLFCLS